MSKLTNQLAAAEAGEVARGIRLLLARPLLTAEADPAGFDLVRRRHPTIARWFDYACGWSLLVEPRRGYARLAKVRAGVDGSRPARRTRSGRAAFDRRRYVLLCVVSAELLSMPVTTIGLLADRVVRATATDRALPSFAPVDRRERMAFVDVLKLLESYGVVRAVDGATDAYVESAEAKVLYRVDTTLLMRLPTAPVGASRLAVPPEEVPARFGELLAGLTREPRYGAAPEPAAGGPEEEVRTETAVTAAQRNLRLRHSVLRRLFDEPVLYRDDLSEEELAYVTSPSGRQLLLRMVGQAGFLLEERAEGFLLVDPEAVATDQRFPDDSSTARVAALLLLEPLCAAPAGMLPEQLRAFGTELLRRFPGWAKAYRSEEGAERLMRDAVRVLRHAGLLREAGDRVVARPAAFRYRVADPAGGGVDEERGGERARPDETAADGTWPGPTQKGDTA
ncbi:TIGR02678 family protein [Streptomyces sp. 3MP-14]|uniref:TIGR02678 family protein n=1 Tax=Streptomyces mimosae TaxID=2586635 RepID=A0A5N6AJL2_9ACTN|nr:MULTISPECIES: TIGR02678 family protein [Streptomyces]KAB8167889.1 TIGR02678 family protein [Streptomyces mimosae]KAB8177463.1 TIGR02678 family protein [Streptomyces sp. 3MP-14]